AGRGGADDETTPTRTGRIDPGHDRGAARVRRRRAGRPTSRREESGEGADRGLHDRRERCGYEVSRAERLPLAATDLAFAGALAADRRAGWKGGRAPAARAQRTGAGGVSGEAAAGGSGALSRSLAVRRQAPGTGRVRDGAPRSTSRRTLRARGKGLHTLHGAEPALSGSHHTAP